MTGVLVLHAASARWAEPQRFADALATLPGAEQERVLRPHRASDRQATLVGRLLLAAGLRLHGHPTEALAGLCYTAYGKPFLPSLGLDFNISHSGDRVVCAIAAGQRVGIDIEALRPLDLGDFGGCMDDRQWAAIRAAAEPHRRFLELWTMKESVAKCQGEGLALELGHLHDAGGGLSLNGETWACSTVAVAQGYACHLATKTAPESLRLLAYG